MQTLVFIFIELMFANLTGLMINKFNEYFKNDYNNKLIVTIKCNPKTPLNTK